MKDYKLFSPSNLGSILLKNRVVMAPMTRSRAIGNLPNDLMAEYYRQRSGAGLIITEGTSPSPNGLGYARIPGIFDKTQIKGWKKTTSAVHDAGGKILIQLMHTGRISHSLNLPKGAQILAPSAVKAAGQVWTDLEELKDFPVPKAMTAKDIALAIVEFEIAASNAMQAGFDGVELHAANGYLLEQFLSPYSNIRQDQYGGSIINRCRFVTEVATAVAAAIGKDKTAIRLSPYGVAGDMPPYPEIDFTYSYLAKQLNHLGIIYLHIVDHSSMGAPEVPMEMKKLLRNVFEGDIILSGGYNLDRAETDLQNGLGNLVAFGHPFINNPDLVTRFMNQLPLSENLHSDLFYVGDEDGYTDYPNYKN